jgi:hypothetical protein
MLTKVLKIIGGVVGALVVVLALVWLFRSDPIGPLAGRALSGEESPYPSSWSFTDEHMTIAVETRPVDPHSVTTICFVHEGDLYIPAQGGSEKRWTRYVLEDPRVRIKAGEGVYPARLRRVTDADVERFVSSAAAKYARMADPERELPEDIWLFRVEPR